jgi:hypothetical protein
MKTFEKDYKTNFVDDANVLVGFDNYQSCCENFGHFLSRKVPTKTDEGEEGIDADGFNFDTKFFRSETPADEYFEDGGMVTFRLTKGDEEIFLTLYNSHNGYYSHGFEMEVGGEKIHDGSL